MSNVGYCHWNTVGLKTRELGKTERTHRSVPRSVEGAGVLSAEKRRPHFYQVLRPSPMALSKPTSFLSSDNLCS